MKINPRKNAINYNMLFLRVFLVTRRGENMVSIHYLFIIIQIMLTHLEIVSHPILYSVLWPWLDGNYSEDLAILFH